MQKTTQKRAAAGGVFLAVLFLALAGCGDPGEDPGTSDPVSINGSFTTGGSTKYFALNGGGDDRAAGKRAAEDTVSLTGTLDDGDMTFRLSGTYDTVSKAFSVSSASTYFRYTIGGDTEGKITASIATRTSADAPFETPEVVVVSEATAEEVTSNMTSTEVAETVTGLDESDWQGVWHDPSDDSVSFLVNEWGIMLSEPGEDGTIEERPLGISSIRDNNNGTYDLILDASRMAVSVSYKDYIRFLADSGKFLFDYQAWPIVNGNCLVFKEQGWDPGNTVKYYYGPEVSYGEGMYQFQASGVRCGDYVVGIAYDTSFGPQEMEYGFDQGLGQGSAEKPFVLVGYGYADLTANGFSAQKIQWPEVGTTYATLAEALAKAEELFGAQGFEADDYLVPDAGYTAALRQIRDYLDDNFKAWGMDDAAIRPVVLEALKQHVSSLANLEDGSLEMISELDLTGPINWVSSAEATAWAEVHNYTVYTDYWALQISHSALLDELYFKIWGDRGATLQDMESETGTAKFFKETYAEAEALLTNGAVVNPAFYTLVR